MTKINKSLGFKLCYCETVCTYKCCKFHTQICTCRVNTYLWGRGWFFKTVKARGGGGSRLCDRERGERERLTQTQRQRERCTETDTQTEMFREQLVSVLLCLINGKNSKVSILYKRYLLLTNRQLNFLCGSGKMCVSGVSEWHDGIVLERTRYTVACVCVSWAGKCWVPGSCIRTIWRDAWVLFGETLLIIKLFVEHVLWTLTSICYSRSVKIRTYYSQNITIWT